MRALSSAGPNKDQQHCLLCLKGHGMHGPTRPLTMLIIIIIKKTSLVIINAHVMIRVKL